MLIKIISVNKVTKTGKTGKKYTAIEVKYESNNRITNYTLFSNDPLAERVLGAHPGTFWDVRVVKDGDYFKWADIQPADTPPPVSTDSDTGVAKSGNGSVSGKSSGSTYSTKEEREDTQRKIVRQFAINAAINLLKTDKKTPSPEEIKGLAEEFVSFVYDVDVKKKTPTEILKDLEEDIPF